LSGQETPATAQTLFEQTGDGILGGDVDTGTDIASDTDTGLDAGFGSGTSPDTGAAPAAAFTLRESVLTGSQPAQRPASGFATEPSTVSQPTPADSGLGETALGSGGFGAAAPTRPTPPRRVGLEEDDLESDADGRGLLTDDELFESGILSGSEALDEVTGAAASR